GGGWSRRRSRASGNHWGNWFSGSNRLSGNDNRGLSMIDRRKLLTVLRRLLPLLDLRIHRRNTLLTNCGDFRRQRATSNTSWSVVAHTRVVIDGDIVDCSRDSAVVHLNIGDGHIVDRP